MVTKVTKYIGAQASAPSGVTTDFATLNLFDNWVSTQDLVAQDIWIDALVFKDQSDADVANCYMNPATCDATHYVVLRPYTGMSARELENNATGPAIYGTQGIELTMTYQRVQVGNGVFMMDFRINVTDNGSTGPDLWAIWVGPQTNSSQPAPSVSIGGLYRNRIKSVVPLSGNGAVRNSSSGGANFVTDNLFFQTSGAGTFVKNACNVGLIGRNTFIKSGTATGNAILNGTSTTPIIRNNAFSGCSATPITIGSGSYTNITSNYSDVSTTQTGVTFGSPLVTSTTDARPASGSILIGGGNASSQGTLDYRGNNRGATPDAGAVQLTPAASLPTGTVTSVTVSGRSITVSGTTTGIPTAAQVSLTPTGKAYNGGVAVPLTNATLGTNTFTITFTNVNVGEYTVSGNVSNSGGSSTLVNNQANPEVIDAQGTITSQTMSGQTLTVSGTTTGTPTSATIIVPASATPNGASTTGPTAVTLGTGTFTVSVPLVPGSYDAPVVRFTTSAGTSFPAPGGSTFQILAISGNPEGPPTNPTPPGPTTTVPTEPQNVIATGGWQSASVAFSPPLSDGGAAISGYTVTASTGQIQTGTASPITIAVTGGVPVNFTVHATNSIGNGPESIASNTVTPTVNETTPPVMNGSLSVTGLSVTGFTVNWPAASDNVAVTGYKVSIDGGANYTDVGNVLTKAVSALTPATTYNVSVLAYDAANNLSTPLTTVVTTSADTTPPVMAGSLAFTNVTATSFKVTWSAATDNIGVTGYEISTDNGATYTDVGGSLTYTKTGATPNTQYPVVMRAYDAAGNRPTGLTGSVTTSVTVPGAPTSVLATASFSTAVVAFTAPANDGGAPITSYTVTASTGETASGASSPITITVPNGVGISFTVTATNSAGTGPASLPSNVVVPGPLVINSVTVTPANATVQPNTTLQLTATVNKTGVGGSGTVTWFVDGGGTISSTGLFTAPAGLDTVQLITITAVSNDDSNVHGTSTLVIPANVVVQPDPVRLRSYNATVRNNTGTAVEGAEITVFDQNTLQPVQLWKDAGKTIERHNPIKTDESGYFEFFVEAAQCGYTVKGFGIKTYTRNNIFDVATAVDLTPLTDQITVLQDTKVSVDDLAAVAAQKASVSDLNQAVSDLQGQIDSISTVVTVNQYVTGGAGTEANPWTGWATAIDWAAYTQYDFEDGYYAYAESPNFAKNFLKLNGKKGSFLIHTGTNYALLCDAGANSEFVVGVEININLKGNTNSNGGVYMRACCYSNFEISFFDIPGICFTEYSGVLNKYTLKRSDIMGTQALLPTSVLESNRRLGSSQSSGNEYHIIAERTTGTAIVLNDCAKSRFNGGTAGLCNSGLLVSATSSGNTFSGIDFNSNDLEDITCLGDFNSFESIRSGGSSTFTGSSNVVRGGMFDQIVNTGSDNSFGPLAYGSNRGTFADSGKNTIKRSVVNLDTGVMDNDQYQTIKDLKATGKTTLGGDTMNVGDGQFYKDPSGKVGINQTTFINDAPLQVTNPNNTATAEGLRVTLGTAALGTSAKLACLNTGGSDVFIVLGNGNTQNFNNSYGAISDIRYKENIVAATPKLDKLMQVNVVNYNLIGQNEQLLGVISQELEQVFPGMIETVPVMENGEQIADYKAVKYSVFVPMLIKAIQELKQQLDAK